MGDEKTSKVVYENLQIIMEDINEENKEEKVKKLKEELISLQMEQTKLMPSLPKELLENLPEEISFSLNSQIKDALLTMCVQEHDKGSSTIGEVTSKLPDEQMTEKLQLTTDMPGSSEM